MAGAWIKGKTATLEAATNEAAKLLRASRMPLIAGLGTDVAGARAAIALARKIGAVIDHMHSTALLRDLDVMRESGMMITTPNEARLRADLLLLVGPGLVEAWPEIPKRLFERPGTRTKRRIVWLCPGQSGADIAARWKIDVIGENPADLPVMLSALRVRARIAGNPVASKAPHWQKIDALASELAQARFGVAVWSALQHDELTIEMLCGLVKDLNATTRFSSLPLAPPDNAAAVQQVSGWITGFPVRTGFGRGYPEHDPWRFDAVRLVDSGETDCALWISAFRPVAPPWKRDVPIIALTNGPDSFERPPTVAISVGRPGSDHDSVEYLAATGTLVSVTARARTDTISVADAIDAITAALPASSPC
ncbi:MAG TPA: tungsten formylmethanofuran dehydrogenase [Pseudolabrys sp.]|nr:tungsten formylmethanofuran dehydrogenase [Pseudolabrys sp.]